MKRVSAISILLCVTFSVPAAMAQSKQIKLTKLEVDEKLTAGVGYDVGLRFEASGSPEVTEVCFLWSGEGPFCWKSFNVDKAAGLIKTKARTGNPNKYTLTGFVRYRDGANTVESNRVSAPIDVRRAQSQSSFPSSSQSPPDVKLPSNISVEMEKPAADVPAGHAAFLGKWGGHWGGSLPSNLIVESVNKSGEAKGVYAWGDHPSGAFKGGATKFRAKIENGTLSWGGNVKFEFKVLPDNKLQGERYNNGVQDGSVVMARQN